MATYRTPAPDSSMVKTEGVSVSSSLKTEQMPSSKASKPSEKVTELKDERASAQSISVSSQEEQHEKASQGTRKAPDVSGPWEIRAALNDSVSRGQTLEEMDELEVALQNTSVNVTGSAQQEDGKSNVTQDPDMEVGRALTRNIDKAGGEIANHDLIEAHEKLFDVEDNPFADPNNPLAFNLLSQLQSTGELPESATENFQKLAEENRELMEPKPGVGEDAAKIANDMLTALLNSADKDKKQEEPQSKAPEKAPVME